MRKSIFKSSTLLSFALLFAVLTTSAQSISDQDMKSITRAAKDYAEGYYSGSGERMERAIHPDLRKYALLKVPAFTNSVFIESSWSGLVQMSYAGAGKASEETWKLDVLPLYVDGEIACARLTSSQFNDCLHMVSVGDDWKIANVLWAFGPDSRNRSSVPQLNTEEEKPAITQLVSDFFSGLFTGDDELVKNALSDKFTAAKWTRTTADGNPFISRDPGDLLIQLTQAKMTMAPEGSRDIDMKILDIIDGMATIRVNSAMGISYLHACYVDGVWKLVHMIRYQAPRG